jgi:hypothetical protein
MKQLRVFLPVPKLQNIGERDCGDEDDAGSDRQSSDMQLSK